MFNRRCMALVPLGVNVVYTHRVWMSRTTRAERTERRKPWPLSSNERGVAAGRQDTRSARLPGGYTLQVNGQQERRYDAAWSRRDAEEALAKRLLERDAPRKKSVPKTFGEMVDE